MNKFKTLIKWSGSKASQATSIIKYFPKKIKTYYEPFLGGGSVLLSLLESDIDVDHIVCSDINRDLISTWLSIKENPLAAHNSYRILWNKLNEDDDLSRRQDFYRRVRDSFNKIKSPYLFLFLTRTCYNGLIRYNSKGEFNTSFHFSRKGINPEKFKEIILYWNSILLEKNVEFECASYDKIQTGSGDFVYLDPPYANTSGMYFGGIKNEDLWEWLRQQPSEWALSFDGSFGDNDFTYEVPKDIYSKHVYIDSGNSSLRRLKGVGKGVNVFESLYLS